jgi:hypothetical protein
LLKKARNIVESNDTLGWMAVHSGLIDCIQSANPMMRIHTTKACAVALRLHLDCPMVDLQLLTANFWLDRMFEGMVALAGLLAV